MKLKPQAWPMLIASLFAIASAQHYACGQELQPPPPPERPAKRKGPQGSVPRYSLEQAMSDQAQLHTIAFSGLAFLTGDFAADTFLPPGKVSDYFGFQYMRDVDEGTSGHNSAFLTRIAFNVLSVLNAEQRHELIELAARQQPDTRRFATLRLPLMMAFRENLRGRGALNRTEVLKRSAELYQLDGEIALQRAQVMARVLSSLSDSQRQRLSALKYGDSRTWPEVPEYPEHRDLSHESDVLVMTYASEMFAWFAGNLTADTYFCPERHAMYFGAFGLKTAPALGKQNYAISTSLTADAGANFLAVLSPDQRRALANLPDQQRASLIEIASVRKLVATELRRLLSGQEPSRERIRQLSGRYGELDGQLAFLYAQAFAGVYRTLTAEQRSAIQGLRESHPGDPKGPFLYADPLPARDIPSVQSVSAFFASETPGAVQHHP